MSDDELPVYGLDKEVEEKKKSKNGSRKNSRSTRLD